jgi:hypothetical protein
MPTFKVTLVRWHRPERELNPFLIHNVFSIKRPCTERVWEFEAADEAEVRRLFDEARAAGYDNVLGFDLARIEQVKSE